MVLEGISIEDARKKIWMFDIDGLLANERKEGNLEGHKKYYAKDHAPTKDFSALVNEIKPSILIGKSAFQFLNQSFKSDNFNHHSTLDF